MGSPGGTIGSLHPNILGHQNSVHPDVLGRMYPGYSPQSVHPDVLNGPPYGADGKLVSYITQIQVVSTGSTATADATIADIESNCASIIFRIRYEKVSDLSNRYGALTGELTTPVTTGTHSLTTGLVKDEYYNIYVRCWPATALEGEYEASDWLLLAENCINSIGNVPDVTPATPEGY